MSDTISRSQINTAVSRPPVDTNTRSSLVHRTLVTWEEWPPYWRPRAPRCLGDKKGSYYILLFSRRMLQSDHNNKITKNGLKSIICNSKYYFKLTDTGYSKSFTKPKSSPLASKLQSLVRQVALTSVTSLPGGNTPLTVGPRTQVNVDHCSLSTSGTLMVLRLPVGAS